MLDATVVTPIELSAAQMATLQQALMAKYEADVKLTVEINENLTAGYQLKIGDQLYDYSLNANLARLKQQILESRK